MRSDIDARTIGAGVALVKAHSRCYKRRVSDETRECPMCGESMRVKVREDVQIVPGTQQKIVQRIREWVCPECDYFEEVEPDTITDP
jgi:YgiT-type zinc finger domain-containing protein